jgi:GNAT superfamily N-acetyltransferase
MADLFNQGFEDYIGTLVNFTADSLAKYMAPNYISVDHSHAFYDTENPSEPIGFALIAIRPDKPTETRLAAMGVAKAHRGKGVGPWGLKAVLDAEKARGTKVVGFECIKQNERALKMYTTAGCVITRELLGWQYTPGAGEFSTEPELEKCSFDEVDALVKAHGAADLPWQTWAFSKAPETHAAFRLRGAYCVVTDPEKAEDMVKLACLIVDPAARGRGEATRLVKAMMAQFPGKKWMAPPVFPKEYGERLAASLGCEITHLTQYQLEVRVV